MKNSHIISFLLFACFFLACSNPTTTSEATKAPAVTETEKASPATSGIKGNEINYRTDKTQMKGYIAYDENVQGKRPGVIVVHEWWGHNDYARKRTEMLAEMGYVALALDMYGDGQTAAHPADAGKFAGQVMSDMPEARARFEKAMETLKNNPNTDPDKIAAIGYCFGGGVVLNMAMQGVDLDGVASFHGSLPTPDKIDGEQVKAKVLVCHGADDPFVATESISQFKKIMADAKVDMTFEAYPGALHSFTNPDADENGKKFELPLAYNKEADEKSWASLTQFLKDIF